jgi:SpoVK/Ycf46/Vps4 family AAA+-type ATPase
MIKNIFYFEDKSVTVHSENTEQVTDKVLPGYYTVSIRNDGSMNIMLQDFSEIHKPFPNQKAGQVIDAITKFLNPKYKGMCRQMGYLYKLNVLLHGKVGVGKTALLNYISKTMIDNHEAIVFRVDSEMNLNASLLFSKEIRRIQDNPIVLIADEFDQFCTKSGESIMKNILDGNRSIDNSIFLAATNYMDRIPATIKERPSRFRIVFEIDPITDKGIIKNLINDVHSKCETPFLSDEEIDAIVNEMDYATVDQIKNLIIDKLMGISLELPSGSNISFADKRKPNKKSPGLENFQSIIELLEDESGVTGETFLFDMSELSNKPEPTEEGLYGGNEMKVGNKKSR